MPYQSRRQRQQESDNQGDNYDNTTSNASDTMDDASRKKMEREEASKKALKTAAKGAGAYFGGPVGAKVVDKVADTAAGQRILNKGAKALNRMPGVGKNLDRLNKAGAIDAADKGIDVASSGGKGLPTSDVGTAGAAGGGQAGSLPSSPSSNAKTGKSTTDGVGKDTGSSSKPSGLNPFSKKSSLFGDKDDKSDDESAGEKVSNGIMKFGGKLFIRVAIIFLPLILIVLLVFLIVTSVTSSLSNFSDALGISQLMGEDTGGLNIDISDPEQQAFYERINEVKMSYQASGRTVDALKIVSVYHVLVSNGANISYKDMDQFSIMEIADAMFDGNTYSDDTFKNNLINSIIPRYLPNSSATKREQMADDILNYSNEYYSLIGKDMSGSSSSLCASTGSCAYDIKGFYIKGKGNVSKNLQVTDLLVRLMQCGHGSGHDYGGTFGQPLAGEELVPFEKYILGVAYQEIGPTAPAEALKAQLVAARSFILARPFDMGKWRTLKQEADGRWVIQVAACTQDQVYCDPDQGCSTNKDGQWGQVHSGLSYPRKIKGPLSQDAPLRKYAAETVGEVLVNGQGYIIYTDYAQSEQNLFSSLARRGLNYKQILLQVYNQGGNNYKATTIQKANCNDGSSSGCSTSEASTGSYANWKQSDSAWANIKIGTSGKTIHQIGCLVTSVSMLIAKSGVQTNISNFNPGTFVEYLNSHNGFSGGNFNWQGATSAAPTFKYQNDIRVAGWSKEQKLNKIKELVGQKGVYVVAEVKGNTGQHWVAIDSVSGDRVNMMDPGSNATDMWAQYPWGNTSRLVYYKVD